MKDDFLKDKLLEVGFGDSDFKHLEYIILKCKLL